MLVSMMVSEEGRAYRGWYCFFHIKGDAALPIAYPIRTIAFVVTPEQYQAQNSAGTSGQRDVRLVCPEVVCDTHASPFTNGTMAMTGHDRVSIDQTGGVECEAAH